MVEYLKISPFNTIKGDIMNEVDIDTFFKKIEKGINKCNRYHYHDDFGVYLCYDTNVYKINDSRYKVSIYDKSSKDYKDYYIDTKEFPQYDVQLDYYVKITNEHEAERNSYRNIENNEVGTTKENREYLNYLDKANRCCSLDIVKKIASILKLPLFAVLVAVSYASNAPFAVGLFMFLCIRAGVSISDNLSNLETYSIDGKEYKGVTGLFSSFKHKLMIKRRMKKVKKMLDNSVNLVLKNNNISKDNVYNNAVYNYINNIMNNASIINTSDKREILLELRSIMEDYTEKCKAINNSDGLTLSLNNNIKQVTADTIDKLTSLEMKINDIISKDNKNKELYLENEKLMLEINNNIASIDEGKKLTLSRGRK